MIRPGLALRIEAAQELDLAVHHLHDTLLRELLQDPVERRPRHPEAVGDVLLPGVGVVRVQVGQKLLAERLEGEAADALREGETLV